MLSHFQVNLFHHIKLLQLRNDMAKSYEDLKLELVLGFAKPTDTIEGTKLKYDNIMNPAPHFEHSTLCQFVLYDLINKRFIKEAEITVNKTVTIRCRNYVDDKFIKYELSKDDAVKQFLIVKSMKALTKR